MTRAFDQAIEAAAHLSDEEQDKLASEIMEAVKQSRFRARMAWRERMLQGGGPLDGRSEELLAGVREFREDFAFRHEREGE